MEREATTCYHQFMFMEVQVVASQYSSATFRGGGGCFSFQNV